jgi:SOS-response transcriptional repressor LexA
VNPTEIGQRVKARRREKGMTQKDLAAAVRCSQPMIVNIEQGGHAHERLLRDVSDTLGVEPDWLLTGKGPKESSGTKSSPAGNVRVEKLSTPYREVPVVSWATAGAARDYRDLADFLDEKVVTECKDPNAFAVIVDGDSMEPAVCAGDRVVVSPNTEAQGGDLVIARMRKDHGVYFKKFLRYGPRAEKVRLTSLNPEYPPLEFELSDFRFIYPVVNLVRIYKRAV